MQTPLITNFARGVISPKFLGRVESDIYYQGAKTIENFIVNNQGSVERRPGTYRVWNTGFTHPSPAGQDDDRFTVEYDEDRRYTLLMVNDQNNAAQFILSSGGATPEHRFFEIARTQTNTFYNSGLFTLTEFASEEADPNDVQFFPEAHAFETGTTLMIDDAFISSISNVTFMRLRNPLSYTDMRAVVWHAVASRDIARRETSDVPFVKIAPIDPPEYNRRRATVDSNYGFRIFDQEDNEIETTIYQTQKVRQFVGQTLSGTYEDGRVRSRLGIGSGANRIRNVNGETLISNHGKLVLAVPDTITRTRQIVLPLMFGGGIFTDIPVNYSFYQYYGTYTSVKVGNQKIDVTPFRNQGLVHIDFRELGKANSDWTNLEKITIQRANVELNKCVRRGLFGNCRSRKDIIYEWSEDMDIPSDWLDAYKNRVYDLDTVVEYSALSTYILYYRHGPSEVLLGEIGPGKPTNDVFSIQHDGSEINSVTIFNEADINWLQDEELPAAGAEFIIERVMTVEERDVITRRIRPWDRNESSTDFALEIVTNREDWANYSMERLQTGRSVIVHNGRLMMIEDDETPRFQVSAIRNYANFYENESEVDAYDLSIETERKETIQWAVSVREGIIVGTDKNEYVIVGIESPSSVQSRRFTGIGSSKPYAIRFGDKILFISRDGKRIMAYSYSDELSAWFSSDVSSIAEHLFTSGIQSMHYMEDPISVIWVVPESNDGIYALTWEPAMGVQAWSHHMKGVNVVSAAVASVDGVTALFLAVERQGLVTIEALDFREDGVYGTKHYLDSAEFLFWSWPEEEIPDEAFPRGPDGAPYEENYVLDFGSARWARFQGQDTIIQVDGQTQLTLSGANQPHSTMIITIGPIPGADVLIEVDPNVGEQIVTVAVGYPYLSTLATLPIVTQSPTGAGVMKNTQTQRMRVRIDKSGSFQAGNDLENMTRIELREEQDLLEDEPNSNTYSGDVMVPLTSRWSYRPTMYIQSYFAEPLNVLAVMTDSQVFD